MGGVYGWGNQGDLAAEATSGFFVVGWARPGKGSTDPSREWTPGPVVRTPFTTFGAKGVFRVRTFQKGQ